MKLYMMLLATFMSVLSVLATDSKDAATSPSNAGPAQQEQRLGDWTETFQTKVGEVSHAPSYVSVGGMTSGKKLSVGMMVNGLILKAPLVLEVNTGRENFINAMRKSGIYEI